MLSYQEVEIAEKIYKIITVTKKLNFGVVKNFINA